MNESRTCANPGTNLTQPGSRPVLYYLRSADGFIDGVYWSAQEAAAAAKRYWPDQEQDETRSGKGWDIEVVS